MHIGDIPPKTTFHPGNIVYDDVHQPPSIQETERPRVTVNSPHDCPVVLNVPLRILYKRIWSGWVSTHDPNRRVKA